MQTENTYERRACSLTSRGLIGSRDNIFSIIGLDEGHVIHTLFCLISYCIV